MARQLTKEESAFVIACLLPWFFRFAPKIGGPLNFYLGSGGAQMLSIFASGMLFLFGIVLSGICLDEQRKPYAVLYFFLAIFALLPGLDTFLGKFFKYSLF